MTMAIIKCFSYMCVFVRKRKKIMPEYLVCFRCFFSSFYLLLNRPKIKCSQWEIRQILQITNHLCQFNCINIFLSRSAHLQNGVNWFTQNSKWSALPSSWKRKGLIAFIAGTRLPAINLSINSINHNKWMSKLPIKLAASLSLCVQ